MKKILFHIIFLFLIIQCLYPIELSDLIDGVQQRINIKRFSVFEIMHDYSTWTQMKYKNPFIPQTPTTITEYIRRQMRSLQSNGSGNHNVSHQKYLKNIVSVESEFNNFLDSLEMLDEEKVFFLPLLRDIKTYTIQHKTPFLLENMDVIDRFINEVRYMKVDKEVFLEKLETEPISIPETDPERKIINVTDDMQSQAVAAFSDWYNGIQKQYKEQDYIEAQKLYYKAFNYYYGFMSNIDPGDLLRAKDLYSGQYYLTPVTSGMPVYPWSGEDINICNYYLGQWDEMISHDAKMLSIFHNFKRKYEFKSATPAKRGPFPPGQAFEFTYVPGYFTYVAFREKGEFDAGIQKIDSFINGYTENWKTGYWQGYKGFLQLFSGKYTDAASSVAAGMPILMAQSDEILERYKEEIELIKECLAAASRNNDSLSFYQLMKTEYPEDQYFQYWNLTEGYCNIHIGDYAQSIPLLNKVIASNPEEALWTKAAHLYLGFAYVKLGDFENAILSLNNALALPENIQFDITAHYIQAKIYYTLGLTEKAFNKYQLIVQKYGSNTDPDIVQIVEDAKKQAESLIDFEIINADNQQPAQGVIGVDQTLHYTIRRDFEMLGRYEWKISSSRISLHLDETATYATLKGVMDSNSYQEHLLSVVFKTEDGLEVRREVKMTCFKVRIRSADKYFPHGSAEDAIIKYRISPLDVPKGEMKLVVEKTGIPGYSQTFEDNGEIPWDGFYNGANAEAGNYQYILESHLGYGVASVTDDIDVFDAEISGKDVIYLGSSPVFSGKPIPALAGTYIWSGGDKVQILSPDQADTEVKGLQVGYSDLQLEFKPTDSRLSAKATKRILVSDPISIVLTEPQMDPILLNWKLNKKFVIKAVHAQGDPIESPFTWHWSCPLGTFKAEGYQNVNPCENYFTAETTGESVFKVNFSYKGKQYEFERPIFVDKHIAIPSFTFFPEKDFQLDIGDKQEFSVECRYNGDMIEKIGEWYDISQTLRYRVKELNYEDPEGFFEEIQGYGQSLPIRGFRALKHGKGVITAVVNYEIEKKVKGKWLRIDFSKRHDHVFRVVPPIDFRITADQQIFRKHGEINQTKIYAKAVFAGKRIKVGKTYRHKGYKFKILSLKWEPKVGTVVNDDSGDPVYQIPIDHERLTQVGVSGTVEIIDRNRNIDTVEVVGKTPLDFAVLDPQITVSLNPGVNPETIAGVYEFFKIENIKIVIPGIEFEKDIKPGDGLALTTLFGIPLNLDFSWALYESNPVFEAENQFEYGKNVGKDWKNANLMIKFKIDKMEFDQVQGGPMEVKQLEELVQAKITPEEFVTVAGRPVDLELIIPGAPQFDILGGNYHVEIQQYDWSVNGTDQNHDSSSFVFNPSAELEGKEVEIEGKYLVFVRKKESVTPSKFPVWIPFTSSGVVIIPGSTKVYESGRSHNYLNCFNGESKQFVFFNNLSDSGMIGSISIVSKSVPYINYQLFKRQPDRTSIEFGTVGGTPVKIEKQYHNDFEAGFSGTFDKNADYEIIFGIDLNGDHNIKDSEILQKIGLHCITDADYNQALDHLNYAPIAALSKALVTRVQTGVLPTDFPAHSTTLGTDEPSSILNPHNCGAFEFVSDNIAKFNTIVFADKSAASLIVMEGGSLYPTQPGEKSVFEKHVTSIFDSLKYITIDNIFHSTPPAPNDSKIISIRLKAKYVNFGIPYIGIGSAKVTGKLLMKATYNSVTKEYTLENLKAECFVDDLFDYNFFQEEFDFLGFSTGAAQVQIGYKIKPSIIAGEVVKYHFICNKDYEDKYTRTLKP